MQRNSLTVAGQTYVLARGQDLTEVKAATVAAVRANGDLVDLVVYGNQFVSVLVSPGVALVFSSRDVDEDAMDDRDTGNVFAPFDVSDEFYLSY
jgi:hypothetical protein